MAEIFAIDVGGTFTDIVVLDEESGEVSYAKAQTTPSEPSDGVFNAIDKASVDIAEAQRFFHGTTLGINTVLERKGAATGLITTKGFRDELEIARLAWPMYRLHWSRPAPLVPRHLRLEVAERIYADGEVLEPLDEQGTREALERLIERGAESIAVCFLHAYAFPAHEQRVGEIIASEYPEVDYTLSHLVTTEYREYERTATTVVDAMVKPRLARYVSKLETRLAERHFAAPLLITRCDGGVMSAAEVPQRSVRTLISGPASGIMGTATLGRWLEEDNLLATDMGGTSFDAALVIDREPILQSLSHVNDTPLLMPVIELTTIGAGGGSIAWLNAGGGLEVGPHSAGADPGPICYGNGGTSPTFTDAALVSGVIDGDYFLGGEIKLDIEAAARGIDDVIATPLGLEVEEAAAGIVTLVEAKMAATLEDITIGKGHDPRDFALLAYGGGGPLVASALSSRLEIPKVIVPRSPATFSAWGMLTLDIVHDFSHTSVASLTSLTPSALETVFVELESNAVATLEREGVPPEKRQAVRSIDLRYENQEHTLGVALAAGVVDDASIEALRTRFDQQHYAAYGYSVDGPVEVVTYRVRAVGALDKPRQPLLAGSDDSSTAVRGNRRARHTESGGVREWTIYERDLLGAGSVLEGPAIVEEPSTTTLVAPGQRLEVDQLGNMMVTRA